MSTSTGLPAADLVAEARRLMTVTSADSWGRWPRASAMLARLAIEDCIDRIDPELRPVTNASARLMALESLLSEDAPELAREVAHTYGSLSRMIHHHAYELPPTAIELTNALDVIDQLCAITSVRGPKTASATDRPPPEAPT